MEPRRYQGRAGTHPLRPRRVPRGLPRDDVPHKESASLHNNESNGLAPRGPPGDCRASIVHCNMSRRWRGGILRRHRRLWHIHCPLQCHVDGVATHCDDIAGVGPSTHLHPDGLAPQRRISGAHHDHITVRRRHTIPISAVVTARARRVAHSHGARARIVRPDRSIDLHRSTATSRDGVPHKNDLP